MSKAEQCRERSARRTCEALARGMGPPRRAELGLGAQGAPSKDAAAAFAKALGI